MSDYLITFRGHIDIHKRPDGFPHVVEDLVFARANSPEELAKYVNDYSAIYIRLQGMTVRKDAHSIEDFSILDNGRMFVPFHMLTYFEAEVKQITGKLPNINAQGEIQLEDGEALVKN